MVNTPGQPQDDINSLSAWQHAILNSSEYGIISTDTEGVIATFNRTSEILLGYTAEEMIGKQTPALIHVPAEVKEYSDLLSKELGRTIEPGFETFVAKTRLGMIDNREWHYVRKDGSTFPVHLSVTAIRGAEQEIIGFLGTFFDLSERKSFQANLQESESRYEALFDSASDAIILGGVDGIFIECNPAALTIFGCTYQQIIGSGLGDFSPEYQPDGQLSGEKAKIIFGAVLNGEPQFFEWRHTRFDGTAFEAEVSLTLVNIGNISHLLGTVRDITDRKKADEERLQLIRELEIKNTEMERFAYTISHELKSPLVTIGGFAGILNSDLNAGSTEKLPQHIQKITKAVETMSVLLNQLLELSRIGRVTNRHEKLGMDELAQVVVNDIRLQIGERKIAFEIESDIPLVWGDLSRLQEVLQNLIENAIKFSANQPAALIKIGARREKDEAIFYVQDNGIGIDPAYQDRIFSLFERLDPKIEGTGVGLSLVQRIVEDHGGRIWVESEGIGTGSCFCFTLPGPGDD
jgi:PAS domain S-box-containing protein